MALSDVRISVWNPSANSCLSRDVSADFAGGYVHYEDRPDGCGAGELGLGLRYEEVFQRGIYTNLNIVEVSTGDDALAQAITTNLAPNSVSLSGWSTTGCSITATGPGSAGAIDIVGTGTTDGALFNSPAFTVAAGATSVLSLWIDPTALASGLYVIQIRDASTGTAYQSWSFGRPGSGAAVTGTTAGRYAFPVFNVPAGVTSLKVYGLAYSDVETSGAHLRFALPLFEQRASASAYFVPDAASFTSAERAAGAVVRAYVGSTLPYDPAGGEDGQQLYLFDGATLTMGLPMVGLGTDATSGRAYVTLAAPLTMPGNPATIKAYGAGTIVGRRRYAGLIRLRERPYQKDPKATVTLGPLSSAFSEAYGAYTVGATANVDVSAAILSFLTEFSAATPTRWPHLSVLAANFAATTGCVFSGSRQQVSAAQMISDGMGAITTGDQWVVRVGHDRTPRLIRLYTSATNTYTYNVGLTCGTAAFEPLNVDFTDQDGSQTYNTIQVLGNTNPVTGQSYSAIVSDPTALALAGRQIDGAPVTNTALNSDAACAAYARGLLNQFSIARSSGRVRVYTRNDIAPDVMPQGLANGDVMRGVQCVTIAGLDATGSVRNLVPDSDVQLTSTSALWSVSAGIAQIANAFGTSGGFQIPASASASIAYAESAQFAVAPGQSLVVSGEIAAPTATGPVSAWTVCTPDLSTILGIAYAVNGSTQRVTSQPFHLPANYAYRTVVVAPYGNSTVPGAQPVTFSQPQLEVDHATAYVANVAAPNEYGLASSIVTTLDFATLETYQDAAFAAIEPDWASVMDERDRATATQLHGNDATGAGGGTYMVSAAAFPPTFSTSSLVLAIPAYAAVFDTGSATTIPAANVTLPASATSWIWLSSNGTYNVQPSPSTQPGQILYGFASTNATGILGFTPLAATGVVELLIAVTAPGSSPIVTPTGSITYTDGATYSAAIPWDANTGLARWAGVTTINWAYRLTGTNAQTSLGSTSVSGAGGGTDATGTMTIPGLAYSTIATYDLRAQYVSSTTGLSAWVTVATTSPRSAAAPVASGTMPAGTTAAATLISMTQVTSGVSQLFAMRFTTASPASWLKTVRVHVTTTGGNGVVVTTLYLLTPDVGGAYTASVLVSTEITDVTVEFIDTANTVSNPTAVLWHRNSVRIPLDTASAFPYGTTFSAALSGSLTPASGGGTYTVSGALATAIGLPTGSSPLAQYLRGMLVLARPAAPGDTLGGTDTTVSDYPYVLERDSSTLPTVFTSPALPAGLACNIAIAFVDNSGSPTRAYPIATTTVATVATPALPAPTVAPAPAIAATPAPTLTGLTWSNSVGTLGFTMTFATAPASWITEVDIAYCAVGAWVSANAANYPICGSITAGAFAGAATSFALSTQVSGLPPGGPWELHAVAYSGQTVAYDGGFIKSTTALTLPNAAAAAMPTGATFTVSSVTPTLQSALTGLLNGSAPSMRITATMTDTNTPAIATWQASASVYVRAHGAASWGTPIPTSVAGSIANAGVFSVWAPLSPGDTVDVGLTFSDANGNTTAITSLLSNYTVPPISSGLALGPRILADSHFGASATLQNENKIVSGCGENGFTVWPTAGGGSTGTPSFGGTPYTVNGKAYTPVTTTGTSGANAQAQLVTVKPSTVYSYAVLVYVATPGATARLTILDAGFTTSLNAGATALPGTVPNFYSAAANAGTGADAYYAGATGQWRVIAGTFTTPANTTQVQFAPVVGYGVFPNTCYWFGAALWEGAKWQDYVDGSPPADSIYDVHLGGVTLNAIGDTTSYLRTPIALFDNATNRNILATKAVYTGGVTVDSLKPAAAGADVTSANTAADTAKVNGIAAATISQGAARANSVINGSNVIAATSVQYTGGATVDSLKPAAVGADVTSANTAADTAKVNGVAAATVQSYAARAGLGLDSSGVATNVSKSTGMMGQGSVLPLVMPTITLTGYDASGSAGTSYQVQNNGGSAQTYTVKRLDGGADITTGSININDTFSNPGGGTVILYYAFGFSVSSSTLTKAWGPSKLPASQATLQSIYNDGNVPITSTCKITIAPGTTSGSPASGGGGGTFGGRPIAF